LTENYWSFYLYSFYYSF